MAKLNEPTYAQTALFQQWLASTSTQDIDTPMLDADLNVALPIRRITTVKSKTPAMTDADRQRVIDLVDELQEWQAGKIFYDEEVVSLYTLTNELDYLDFMIEINAQAQPDDDELSTLPLILHPRGVKVRVHDDVTMVIGISRKSSRPPPLYFDAQTAEYRSRAEKYTDFYMTRVHPLGDSVDCCKPAKEIVVIFGSSNTDFENSNANGIKDLRKLLKQAIDGQKVVLACSQTDGLCTNMIGLEGFLQPFLSKGIQLELMIWWNNSKFYIYDIQKLIHQFHARSDGYEIESHYEKLLGTMARVADNKESVARAFRANKAEGLGFRNVIEIDPKDDSPEREIVNISMTPEAKQERHIQGLQNASRAVSEVPLHRNEIGKLLSPIDDRTFNTVDQVVEHVVTTILSGSPKSCKFCVVKFLQNVTAGRLRAQVRQHIKRHIFVPIPCQHDCPYKAKNETDMISHLDHAHRVEGGKVEKPRIYQCDQCTHEPFTSQYHLNRHIGAHTSMPVTCNFCQSKLKNQDGLEDHIRRVCPALPKNETQCQLCNKTVWAKKLADHIRIHIRSGQVAEFSAIMGVGQ